MLDDEDELMSTTSEEEPLAGATVKATKKIDGKPAYKLQQVLKPGRTTQYTTRALFGACHFFSTQVYARLTCAISPPRTHCTGRN